MTSLTITSGHLCGTNLKTGSWAIHETGVCHTYNWLTLFPAVFFHDAHHWITRSSTSSTTSSSTLSTTSWTDTTSSTTTSSSSSSSSSTSSSSSSSHTTFALAPVQLEGCIGCLDRDRAFLFWMTMMTVSLGVSGVSISTCWCFQEKTEPPYYLDTPKLFPSGTQETVLHKRLGLLAKNDSGPK